MSTLESMINLHVLELWERTHTNMRRAAPASTPPAIEIPPEPCCCEALYQCAASFWTNLKVK